MATIQAKYYRIATRHTMFGTYELWESTTYGDEIPADVWLNGEKVGSTWDDLETWLEDNDIPYIKN